MGLRVKVAPEAEAWLETCHVEAAVRARVKARFDRRLRLLESGGLAIGTQYVKRVTGYEGLWEVRVADPTGAYRLFFGLARRGVCVIAAGDVKTKDRFRANEYRRMAQKVAAAVAEVERGGE